MTGRELKRIRLQLGLTQDALGRHLGVSRNTVTRWEIGIHPISRAVQLAIEALLTAKPPRADRKGS